MSASPYTRERLTEAAASSQTLTEALIRLGVDPRSPTRKYLSERMRRLGIPTGHFEREGARWTREVLEPAVAASTSVCEVLRRLGIEVVGGHHTHISRRIKALGIDTSHFRPQQHKGKGERRAPRAVLEEQPAETARRIPSKRLKRALTARGIPQRCALCGTGPLWRGRPLPLEVDHIDGNWRNNRMENLRILCPNCHSATDNYRGRGKHRRAGAGRGTEASR
ncbi:HNH endonuclease signature motif containing protein [Streptomyces albipurpureus]|uniref:HNH endonuclease n=1 Tax=Streptomyces albipurpureus TaxID=2897419 RepID=A0ABT0UUG2_9ACTN|nr:HNH endonuclease signature motif containing protein [Streptomyces sp. CWNU-1]MCM2392223.1 HNH endonuclease [Streptomyces sp. CWNU-1]